MALFLLLVVAAWHVPTQSLEARRPSYVKNELAKALSRHLGLGRMSARGPVKADAVSGQLAAILTHLKQSDVSNGPAASALLAQAYEMREDICPSMRTLCIVNLQRQFENAEMMGLFDRQRTFNTTITWGRDLGEQVLFEHIVPASLCPEYSASLANVRIVRPGETGQATEPGAADAQTAEMAERFRAVLEEQRRYGAFKQEERQVDARRFVTSDYGMGRTRAEHEQVWQGFVDEDPAVLEQEPYIRTEVKKTMTRVGYGKNEITATITNRSQHPTEVDIDLRMIGLDELRKKASMELGRIQGSIKLLQLQERDVELQGTTQFRTHRGKVIINNRYRGWVLTVRHAGKVISRTANPDYLLDQFPP